MNREDIIRMAREAGLENVLGIIEGGALHRFFYMAQAAEREECAKVCDERIEYWPRDDNRRDEDENCAAAIRSRGNSDN